MIILDFFKQEFKEKYNSDSHFADNLMPEYKAFEVKYNSFLKEKYPSITDEMKRQLWLSRKIKLDIKNLNIVSEGIRTLIGTNFYNVNLISSENSYLVKYLIEKKTHKIYKVKTFDLHNYHYSTVGEKAILHVKFNIKHNIWRNKVIVKYSHGYLSELAFMFATYSETKHMVDAKLQFNQQVNQIEYKLKQYFQLAMDQK